MLHIVTGIALNSWKQMVRDRIFYVVLIIAFLMLGFSCLLAMLTFVESRKILLDFSFSAVSIASGIIAVYVGIVSVARELEQRTIYTIVSKPVSRSTYLLGKFLGSMLVVAAAHLLLSLNIVGILLLMGEAIPDGFIACLILILLESVILLAFAFLSSSFASSILAAGITLAFFLIGRSNSSFQIMENKGLTPASREIGRVLYYLAPNLERFNIRDVVAYGRPYPEEMLWIGLAYAFAYVAACLSASCLIIRQRDLP